MLLTILYLIFIQPLEFWMDVVLKWGFSLTHSWGLAVAFLSLVVNTAILPIYNKAEGWQEEERELKRRMARHEAMLRQTFKGQKQFALLSTLRRQHGYSYFLSLRASVGLLLQIPFFFAAYHLLSQYEALYGQPFGPLADLGSPDALLNFGSLHVNLLPIAMTVVNLASAFVYTRALTRRDKMQTYGMAALFLILLYNSPAALTLYWTLNNVYSLGKNLVEKWWLRSCGPHVLRAWLRNSRLALLGQDGRTGDTARAAVFLFRELSRFSQAACYGFGIGAIFWLVTCTAVWATYSTKLGGTDIFYSALLRLVIKTAIIHFSYQLILTALSISAVIYICVFCQHKSKLANYPFFISTNVFIVFLFQLNFFKYGFEIQDNHLLFNMWNSTSSTFFLFWFIFLFLIQRNWNNLYKIIKFGMLSFYSNISKNIFNNGMYIYSCIFICLIYLYISFSIYDADITIYTSNPKYIITSIVSVMLSMFILFIVLFIFTPKKFRLILSFISCFCVLSSLFNYLLFRPDFGILEGTRFQNVSFFDKKINVLTELFLPIFVPFFGAIFIIFYKQIHKIYNRLLVLFSLSLLILSGYIIIPHIIKNEQNINYKDKFHSYSKNEANVVVLIFDMFTGGHIEKMIEDTWFGNFSKKMDGFTWYPDTISEGAATIYSLPSIYGGFGYAPYKANKNKFNLVEFINKSYAMMPRNFAKKGYDVVMANGLPEFNKNIYNRNLENKNNISTIVDIKDEMIRDVRPFFLTLSSFQVVPNILRRILYNNGKWNGFLTTHESTGIDIYKNEYDFLDYAINKKINQNSNNPTLHIFYSMISHYTWHIMPEFKNGKPDFVSDPYPDTEGQLILKDGILPEHYFAERHLMHLVMQFINHLKTAGIYDNTRIILVSDHGEADSQMVARFYNDGNLPSDGCDWSKRSECKNGAYAPGRPHALLMVKEPNQRGPLRISSAFMSSADVPALAMKGLGSCDEFELYDPERLPAPRILTHASGSWRLEDHNVDSYNCTFFRFEGTLFDPGKVSEITLDDLE